MQSLASLVRVLHRGDPRSAWNAAEALGALGEKGVKALPALARATRHQDAYVRMQAMDAMRRIAPRDERTIQELRARLKDRVDLVRITAIQCLSVAGRRSVPDLRGLLEQALDDSKALVREAGITAALRSRGVAQQMLPRLKELLRDRSKYVRAKALSAVHKLEHGDQMGRATADLSKTTERIMDLLRSNNALIRAGACEELGTLPIPKAHAVPLLLERLRDPKPAVRAAAASALGEIPGSAALAASALVELMSEPKWIVRMAAANALGRFAGKVPAIRDQLIEMLNGRSDDLRAEAMTALSRQPPRKDLIEPLLRACEDKDFSERATAGHVLARYEGDLSSWAGRIADLLNDDDPDVRAAALLIMRDHELGDETGVANAALKGLQDSSSSVRFQSVVAFERITSAHPEAARLLVKLMLEDQDDGVRYRAGYALHAVGGPPVEALTELTDALSHPDPSVVGWAVSALGDLGRAAEAAVPALMKIASAKGAGSSEVESALIRIKGADFYRKHFL